MSKTECEAYEGQYVWCGTDLAVPGPGPATSQFASDDLSLTLGIAIGGPLGAAYLAVQKSMVVPLV